MSKIIANQISPRSGDNITINGNLSVGGTVTYEDVSNVDSVGIVTAGGGVVASGIGISVSQGGVRVTGVVTATNVSVASSVTATDFYGDGSQLTGVESGVSNFVASGTIPNGATVVINTDGTVGVVTSTGSENPSVGSEVLFNAADTDNISST